MIYYRPLTPEQGYPLARTGQDMGTPMARTGLGYLRGPLTAVRWRYCTATGRFLEPLLLNDLSMDLTSVPHKQEIFPV